MRKLSSNWTKLVFILVPVCIVAVDAAILIREGRQTEAEKAIRLVRESTSRKENFTVQQYIYTTVYYRKNRGEAIEIAGWRGAQPGGPGSVVAVEFSYNDRGGRHTAQWEVDLSEKRITPKNETASDLSWR